ncbi:MAG: AAA family ATPase [Candidatus Hodarchaeota archaeon]
MRQKLVVSVSGKGGVGKTTITTLLLRTLLDHTKHALLVVDADPVMNLHAMLGVPIETTVGEAANKLRQDIDEGAIPASSSKQDRLEGEVYDALIEGDRFDFLAMGRTEGEGCYCFVNRVLTQILDTITANYDITLLDMSAGLEHLSRRTDRNVDVLIIVIDTSKMALDAAIRIRDLAKEVHINFKRIWVIANRFPPNLIEQTATELERRLNDAGLELAGIVPSDDQIIDYNLQGKSLLELPQSNPSLQAVEKIAKRIGLLSEETLLEMLGVTPTAD